MNRREIYATCNMIIAAAFFVLMAFQFFASDKTLAETKEWELTALWCLVFTVIFRVDLLEQEKP